MIDSVALSLFALLPVPAASVVVGLVYRTIFISQGGQTPGKMAAGIMVTSLDGAPLGAGRAFARALAEWLNVLTCAFGYLPAAFSGKRALHDYAAGTRVVRSQSLSLARKALFVALSLGCAVIIAAIFALGIYGAGTFGKYKELLLKSAEGATKGNLGALRSATSIYYGDAEGSYPPSLDVLVEPRYLKTMPTTAVGEHPKTSAWTAYGDEVCEPGQPYADVKISPTRLKDTGGWGYVTDTASKCWGMVFVDCTHDDTTGRPWYGH